jgi:DNA uptake protein ComE-like DNA-binding protein
MIETKDKKHAIKNSRWLISGLIAGAIIGLVVGVAISKVSTPSSGSTIELSKTAAQILGWHELNKINESSKAFDTRNNLTTCGYLDAALTNAYAKLGNYEKKSSISIQKPVVTNAGFTPKIDKPKEETAAKINQNDSKSYIQYKDGFGPIDINTATVQQIDDVPRMSTSTAKEIYNFIHSKGPIKSFIELDSIKNVGEKTIEKLRASFHIKK